MTHFSFSLHFNILSEAGHFSQLREEPEQRSEVRAWLMMSLLRTHPAECAAVPFAARRKSSSLPAPKGQQSPGREPGLHKVRPSWMPDGWSERFEQGKTTGKATQVTFPPCYYCKAYWQLKEKELSSTMASGRSWPCSVRRRATVSCPLSPLAVFPHPRRGHSDASNKALRPGLRRTLFSAPRCSLLCF